MREEVVSLGPFTNSADDDVLGVPAVDASSVSVLYDTFADDATSATNQQHPSNDSSGSRSSSSCCCSCIIFDRATRRLLQRLLVYIAIPSSVGIAAWLITGPWTQHQCSSHIAQLSPPLLWDIDNGTYTEDPELSHLVTGGIISVELLLWTSLGLPLLLLSILPTLVMCYHHYFNKTTTKNSLSVKPVARRVRIVLETAAAVSGFLTAWVLTLLTTCLFKVLIHRPRPNFYSLCRFDSDTLRCTSSSLHRICDSRYSLPSGHSSLSACAMVFVGCYIVGNIISGRLRDLDCQSQQVSRRQNIKITSQQMFWSVVTWIVLCSWAVFVAATRVYDHWHRVSDVSAGLALGVVTAVTVYWAYFGYRGPRCRSIGCCCLTSEPPVDDKDVQSTLVLVDQQDSTKIPDGGTDNACINV